MIAKRITITLATALLSLLGALTIIFILVRLSGDPAELMSPPGAPQSQIDQTRQQLGLDEPLVVQYRTFMSDALHGDMGESYFWRTDALGLVLDHLGPTLALAFAAAAFAVALGVPLGLLAAFRQGSAVDRGLGVGAMLGQAIPSFWMAPVLVLIISVELGWTPTSGMSDGWRSFILPVTSLGAFQLAVLYRITRAASLEALGQDHVRLVRAKGATKKRIAISHVLPGTALPLMTVTGLALASLIGGSVVVERIFAWPGIGNLMIQAVDERDFPVVQSVALVYAIAFIGLNTIVDLLYLVADPRLRKAQA
jgi:ABC-type dipeptide/oligopeptide/nickel transport system permease component